MTLAGFMSRCTTWRWCAIVQRVRKPADDFDSHGRRKQPVGLRVFDEVSAAQQLHRDVRHTVVLARIEDRHDVGMTQPARHLRFPKESPAGFLELTTLEFVRQRDRLQCDLAVDHRVACAVDDAHGAFAELVQDLVAAECRRQRTGGQSHAGSARR